MLRSFAALLRSTASLPSLNSGAEPIAVDMLMRNYLAYSNVYAIATP